MTSTVLQSIFDSHGNDLIQTILHLGLHGSPTGQQQAYELYENTPLTNQPKGLQNQKWQKSKRRFSGESSTVG